MAIATGTLLAGAAIAGAASVGANAIGAAKSAGDRQRAVDANKSAIQEWLDINIPDPESQKIALQKYVQTGQLDPKVEEAIKQDPSAFEKIQSSPRLKQAQLSALSSLEDLGAKGGMTLEDDANLQKGMSSAATADRGRREAILNQYAARGLGGSGLELAAQMQSTQDASQRQNQAQLDTMASARARALQAIMGGGELAGKIRGQDYSEQADAAKAKDLINQFNTQNMQGVMNRNVNRQNQADEYNLGLKQRASDLNTGVANEQEKYNKGLNQQRYQNELARAAGVSGQYNKNADAYNKSAQQTADQWANIGSGIGQIATAGLSSGYMNKQPQPQQQAWQPQAGIMEMPWKKEEDDEINKLLGRG